MSDHAYAAPPMAQDIIKKGESLNLERCIEIALKKQPVIAAAVGNVDVNASLVGQAKSNYYPQINWSSSYNRVFLHQTETLSLQPAQRVHPEG